MALVNVNDDGTFPDITLTALPGNSDVGIINSTSAAVNVPLPGGMRVASISEGGVGHEPTHNLRNGIATIQPNSHLVLRHTPASAETVEFTGMVTTHKTAAANSDGRGTALIIQLLLGGASDDYS